jgi:hypothetical protein
MRCRRVPYTHTHTHRYNEVTRKQVARVRVGGRGTWYRCGKTFIRAPPLRLTLRVCCQILGVVLLINVCMYIIYVYV